MIISLPFYAKQYDDMNTVLLKNKSGARKGERAKHSKLMNMPFNNYMLIYALTPLVSSFEIVLCSICSFDIVMHKLNVSRVS